MRTRVGIVVSATIAVSLIASPSTANAAPPDIQIVNGTVVETEQPITTEAELETFIESAAPKYIEINEDLGKITRVSDAPAVVARGVTNGCAAGAVCWQTRQTPYANWGFSGNGTYNGTWDYRGTFKTYNWNAQAWYWRTATPGTLLTTGRVGPGSIISFTGSGITGKSVKLG